MLDRRLDRRDDGWESGEVSNQKKRLPHSSSKGDIFKTRIRYTDFDRLAYHLRNCIQYREASHLRGSEASITITCGCAIVTDPVVKLVKRHHLTIRDIARKTASGPITAVIEII